MPATTSRWFRALCVLGAASLPLLGCRDEAPRRAENAMFDVAGTVQLLVGQEGEVELRCVDSDGRDIPRHRVTWVVDERQIANIRPAGRRARIRGLHVGTTWLTGGCGQLPDVLGSDVAWLGVPTRSIQIRVDSAPPTAWEIDFEGDTIELRAPTPEDSVSGATRLLSVRARTVTGEIFAPDRFIWTSDAPDVASISPLGVVSAHDEGLARLTVAGLGAERAVHARVTAAPPPVSWDVAMVDAHWTQGVQDERQSVPIFREGRAAVVNVLAFATADAPAASVILHVRNSANVVIWTDTATLASSVDSLPTFATPSAQFLVPRAVVNSAADWRVERDTLVGGRDALGANDRLPRTGYEPLRAVTPPVLRLRLVPVRLRKHGDLMTPVNPSTTVYYDSIARIRLPIGRVEITIGTPLTTDADFFAEGGSTIGGDDWFFSRVLEEIDAARVAHPTHSASIWVGVIPRPAGATSRWAGMAYFPSSPTLSGPLTRSQVVLGHDAYTTPWNAGRLVAHELGHNFGREHAPCGNVGWPDPRFPKAGGQVGRWLHWTSRWEHGEVDFASTIPDTAGDLMGYCGYQWVSAYTYLGILNFRQLDAALLLAPAIRERVLVVRGVAVDGALRLSTPRVDTVAATAEDVTSSVVVEVLDASGGVIVRRTAQVGRTGDPEAGTPFALHLPWPASTEQRAQRIRVRLGTAVAERALSAP